MSDHLQRARMLLDVDRHEEAARELAALLADEPEHAQAHVLLAVAHAKASRWTEALDSARKAVGLAPESPVTHYMLGTLLCDMGREKQALASAREARRLDAEDPDVHALVARCFAGLSNWKEVQRAADRGLALEPTHVDCLNLRAAALRMLGRSDAARAALDTALAEDPDDPDTHTSYGFARLQEGDARRALEHFREALRLDPSHGSARTGLAEALKARNPLYRPILWWMLFSARFSQRRAVLIGLGLMFGARALAKTLGAIPGLQVLAGLVVVVYLLAMWTSWVGAVLFDLLLFLRRDTRDVLLPHDRNVALCLGGTILAAPLAAGAVLAFGPWGVAMLAGAAFLAAAIPVAGGLHLANLKARWVGGAIAVLIVATALLGTAIAAYEAGQATEAGSKPPMLGAVLLLSAILGSVLSSWALTGLRFLRPSPAS